MNRFLLLILTAFLMSYAFGQNHITDSTVFLKLGNEQIECKKRFLIYDPNIYKEGDTTFYNPPRLFSYSFSDYHPTYVKTFKHLKYLYIEDEFGDIIIGGEYESDSTYVSTYFGEISKDSLLTLLKSEIILEDRNNKYPIKKNFTIQISRQTAYREVVGFDLNFVNKLIYEIQKTDKGDIVILNNINFNSIESHYPFFLKAGYWKIK